MAVQGIVSNMSNESAIEMNDPVSQEMTEATYEEQAPVMGDIETSISGAITALAGESITVQEPEKVVVIPGPTPDLNSSVTVRASITAKITSNTQYNNITREALKVGDQVILGAKQTSADPIVYEVLSVGKSVMNETESMPEAKQAPEQTMEQAPEAKPSL